MNQPTRPPRGRIVASPESHPTHRFGIDEWRSAMPAVLEWLGFIPDDVSPEFEVDLDALESKADRSDVPGVEMAQWAGDIRRVRALRLVDAAGSLIGDVAFPTTSTRRIPPSGDYPEPTSQESFESTGGLPPFGVLDSSADAVPARCEVVLRAEIDGDVLDVAWRDTRRLYLGFPLFEILASELNFEPLEHGYFQRSNATSPDSLRRWLVREIDALLVGSTTRLPSGGAWPDGKTAGLTIRLDHDRPVDPASIDDLIRIAGEHGARLSSGFLVRKPDVEAARRIRDAGHEILLHTEAGSFREFLAEIESFKRLYGFVPRGYTAHGGRGSRGWIGQAQWEWAMASGMIYGEMLGRSNRIPHRAVIRGEDGSVYASDLVLPGVHLSLDAGMRPEAHNLDAVRSLADRAIAAGEHVVLMNHPDIHRDELYELIAHCTRSSVWNCSFTELAKHHRSLHRSSSPSVVDDSVAGNFDARCSMDRLIVVTGFARGGTSWLRNCIASHPAVEMTQPEMRVFQGPPGGADMDRFATKFVAHAHTLPPSPRTVIKGPANAPRVGEACRSLPDAKFVFIVRDPRDTFISHKRSTREWTNGRNSTVEGCLGKLERYWNGCLDGADCDNLLVVRYEDLHQNFSSTMRRIFDHCDLAYDEELIDGCWQKNNFWATGSRNKEDRQATARKGVVGDWVEHLEDQEAKWIKRSRYWVPMMQRLGYHWNPPTYESIYKALRSCDPRFLSAADLVDLSLDANRLNVVMLRDIDLLDDVRSRWVRACRASDRKFGLRAIYNFLPLDDPRYARWSVERVADFIRKMLRNPAVELGMHVNPVERHYGRDLPDLGEADGEAREVILETLGEQIDAFATAGLHPRIGTAHGYGRRAKRPNNRDTPFVADGLAARGIELWDTRIRPGIFEKASHVVQVSDVGGAIAVYGAIGEQSLDDPAFYRSMPPGSVLVMLQHPANYDPRRRLQLGQRTSAEPAMLK